MLSPFLHEGSCRDREGRGSQVPSPALCPLVTRRRGTACEVPPLWPGTDTSLSSCGEVAWGRGTGRGVGRRGMMRRLLPDAERHRSCPCAGLSGRVVCAPWGTPLRWGVAPGRECDARPVTLCPLPGKRRGASRAVTACDLPAAAVAAGVWVPLRSTSAGRGHRAGTSPGGCSRALTPARRRGPGRCTRHYDAGCSLGAPVIASISVESAVSAPEVRHHRKVTSWRR
jgi:hypothetical protein